jgi:hypothetical protein
VLPAPLSNASFNGNYLLFSVDASGSSTDFKLSEYEQYASNNKGSTEPSAKEIKSALTSPFSYDLTKVFIQSEIDRKSKSDKISPTEAKNALVAEYVAQSSTPMNDADYSPEQDSESADGDLDSQLSEDWRAEWDNVLEGVMQRGYADQEVLADRICATFFELNGVEPSLAELQNVFGSVEQDLANEADEDLASEKQTDALRLAEALAGSLTDNPDPTELVDYSTKIVGQDLVSRAISAFSSINGRQPSNNELARSVEKLALKLAASAMSAQSQSSKTQAVDNYNPQNSNDQSLAREDAMETEDFNADHFNLKMLTTASKSGKKTKNEAYDVYFSNFDKSTEQKNLLRAVDSFKMRNRREPSGEEVDAIAQFLATDKQTNLVQFKLSVISDSDAPNDVVLSDAEKTNEKVLVTPVKKKKSAAQFNVYFDDKSNKETALKWFERFNNRKPSELEMSGIEQFIGADNKSELIECEFEVSSYDESKYDDDSKESDEQRLKMTTSKVAKKKSSTTYTLDFAGQSRLSGDAQPALQWFQRFNGRAPNKSEQAQINAFVQADSEQTIDID